ncbi:MAG TPA: GAF domain-containing sensor histidine kinase [Candidatus Dormibacteraeota bacterium]
MPSPKPAPLCVVSGHTRTRRDLARLLTAQGHRVVQAASLSVLDKLAADGIAAAVVDPRTPGLGPDPLARMRAEPALHRCPILLLNEHELAGLDGGRPAPALIGLMQRIYAQVAGGAQLGVLQDVSGLLTAAPDTASTVRNILEAVAGLVATDTATLFLVDGDAIEARAAWGYSLDTAEFRRVERGEGVAGWVIEHGAPTIVGDSDLDDRFNVVSGRSKRSMLAVPIAVGRRVLGAITLTRRAPTEQFSDADLVLVGTISNAAGIALEASRVYEQERAVRRRLAQVEEIRRQESEFLDKLEEYDRLYTQVVATVSHELKTPLMGIRGFAQMIREGGLEPEELADFAAEIHDNAVRLSDYVEGILDEDAVHSGRLRLDPAPVPLQPLVAQVLHAVRPLTGTRHRLVDAVPHDLAPVWGDGDMLQQVLTNLVSNAVKYSPEGGRITVGARATPAQVALLVDDQGIGIPEEARSRVFDRFYRVPGELTRHIPGTGLGLSIVRGLVELHGGSIRVEPGPRGRGSRFIVTLPRASAMVAGASPARAGGGVVALSRRDAPLAPSRRLATRRRTRAAMTRLSDNVRSNPAGVAVDPIAEVS